MRFKRYRFSEGQTGWSVNYVEFKRVNLLVGDSGTGKSRFVNTLANLVLQTVAEKVNGVASWELEFELGGATYSYELTIDPDKKNAGQFSVTAESLVRTTKKEPVTLIKRDLATFLFKGESLPRLSNSVTAISLLKDEPEIDLVYQGFKTVITRRFHADELTKNFGFFAVPPDQLETIRLSYDLLKIATSEIGFHNKVLILEERFPEIYKQLISIYKEAFPFIEEFKSIPVSKVQPNMFFPFPTHVFCFKEKSITRFVGVHDISSGMQKIFMMVLDVLLLRDGGVLIIDEYENSLGINAINFLPSLINNINLDCQFIITSHHPYIINTIPITNWKVFHRSGVEIEVRPGEEFKDKYSESTQENFLQLINDPYYTKGIK